MNSWSACSNVLCVRPDNMGDLLMSAPAIAALKKTFRCRITLLTSSMAAGIAHYLPGVDEVLSWNVPWVKNDRPDAETDLINMTQVLRQKKFDGAVLFTVFSQNPLPTALLLTMAGIPRRLAYCRENPYGLLTHWIPEEEPYTFVRHQVRRDLDLVKAIGVETKDDDIRIRLPHDFTESVREKLKDAGINETSPWVIMHPGVSEPKRQYPKEKWIETGRKIDALGYRIIITGSAAERALAGNIQKGIGPSAFNFAGALSLGEFITLIGLTPVVVSVNTATVHIASAMRTRVVVLYALTNPQHCPWKTAGMAFPFSVPESMQSRNEVLRYVQRKFFGQHVDLPSPDAIAQAVKNTIEGNALSQLPELVLPEHP